jgi:hypothetical protein
MTKYSGSGWHLQRVRHSRARRLGHAGGTYTSERIRKILKKHPEYKNLNFKQLRGKGIFLKYQSDSDRDKVKNIKDCQPLNPKKQDIKETAKKIGAWTPKK